MQWKWWTWQYHPVVNPLTGNGNESIQTTNCSVSFQTLSNVNASSGGKYTCVVSNVLGNYSASTFAFIAPYTTSPLMDVGGSNGSTLTLMCPVEAFPAPQVQWARMDGADIRVAVVGPVLTFDPLMFGDEGLYFCSATSTNLNIQSSNSTVGGEHFVYLSICMSICLCTPYIVFKCIFIHSYKQTRTHITQSVVFRCCFFVVYFFVLNAQ